MAKKVIAFPESLLVRIAHPGTEEESLVVGTTPQEVVDAGNDEYVTAKTARYVLAGTGSIHNSAPLYLEDAKA